MQPETVETLIKKSKFEPDVALGAAQSIDMAITTANLVTVLCRTQSRAQS
jgi:hypothetical protein